MLEGILENPVFEREFVRYCRTKKWYVVRTTLAACLTLVLWLFFLQGRGDIQAGNLDAVGRSLFSAACFVLIVFLILATPGMTADIIASERRTGNLDVLLSTPLPRSGIVFGKVLSRVVLLLVMVASSFPAISVTLLFGGVRGVQVTSLFLVAVGLLLALAGISVLLSTIVASPGLPAAVAYLAAVVPGAVLLYPGSSHSLLVGAVTRLALPPSSGAHPPPFLTSGLAVLGIGAATFLVTSVAALLRLRKLTEKVVSSAVSSSRPILGRSRRSWDRGNPIATWEVRRIRGRPGLGPFWTILALLLLAEAVLYAVPAGRAWEFRPGSAAFVATAESFAILLFAALAGSTTVITDREQGRIELFRLTQLTPREVMLGKAVGTSLAALPLLVVPVLHLLLFIHLTAGGIAALVGFIVLLATAVHVCAADGVLNSIQGVTVQSAILRSTWHFAWLTILVPMLRMLLPLVAQGTLGLPEGPKFSLLYPLHIMAVFATGGSEDALDVFGLAILSGLLLAMLVASHFVLAPRARPRTPRWRRPHSHSGRSHTSPRRAEPPFFTDWQESWQRLAAQWDEEP